MKEFRVDFGVMDKEWFFMYVILHHLQAGQIGAITQNTHPSLDTLMPKFNSQL